VQYICHRGLRADGSKGAQTSSDEESELQRSGGGGGGRGERRQVTATEQQRQCPSGRYWRGAGLCGCSAAGNCGWARGGWVRGDGDGAGTHSPDMRTPQRQRSSKQGALEQDTGTVSLRASFTYVIEVLEPPSRGPGAQKNKEGIVGHLHLPSQSQSCHLQTAWMGMGGSSAAAGIATIYYVQRVVCALTRCCRCSGCVCPSLSRRG
jgi:hypothetical protein